MRPGSQADTIVQDGPDQTSIESSDAAVQLHETGHWLHARNLGSVELK